MSPVLAANASLNASLGGTQATIAGYAADGGTVQADALGDQSYQSSEVFTLDSSSLTGHLILGLIGSDTIQGGFTDLTVTVLLDGHQMVVDQDFATPADAAAYLTDDPVDLGVVTPEAALTVSVTFSFTGSDVGDGFGETLLLGTTGTYGSPALVAPMTAAVGVDQATAITGISLSEAGSAPGEIFTVLVDDSTGLLSASGDAVSGSGTTGLTVKGSLAAVNAALGSLEDTSPSAGSESILFDISDSVGNESAASIDVTAQAVACYRAGTLILTDRGERAIETLAPGDRVVTVTGEMLPIRWIGHRSYDGRFVTGNRDVLPILFRPGSLADGVPRRDLYVSPKHAMLLDGVLIAAELLVNGASVVQMAAVQQVSYFHIELDSHQVIRAEGAASETFVDCDSRMMFQNAAEFLATHPAGLGASWSTCAERAASGAVLEQVRRRLAARAGLTTCHVDDAIEPGTPEGRIDVADHAEISGWAWDPSRPHTRLELEILVDGVVHGSAIANKPRQDLGAAGKGSGRCAFAFRLPLHLPARIVSVRTADGVVLAERRLAEDPAGPGRLDGRIDVCQGGIVSGWAIDAGWPDVPVQLEILRDGEVVGRTLARRHRADLAAAGLGAGNCAFQFDLTHHAKAQLVVVRRASDATVLARATMGAAAAA